MGMKVDSILAPQQVEATCLGRGLLVDLAMKILYLNHEMTLVELSNHMCLGLGVVDEIFRFCRKEQLCEVKGMVGGSHRIAASEQGKARAADLLALNQYVGPAPITLPEYTAWVRAQSVQASKIAPADLRRAFHELVLPEEILSRLGAAVVSGASIFLYGPPGTGKTSIASCIPEIYNDDVWIPHAIEVDNQIIIVYDPGVHRKSERPIPEGSDRRWVLCRRPRVLAGGELAPEMLDIQFNSTSHYYTAPLQMKANNGVLIVDDFGRQRVRPEELLNRWMTPLDRRVDFLTLPGGRKFEIPFDLLVVFSTNLDPRVLADEAFLRRIANKIKLENPTPEEFIRILTAECWTRFLPFDKGAPEYVVNYIRQELHKPLCQCYARDLINQIFWAARYSGVEPCLTRETAQQACRAYFLSAGKTEKPEN
jgi:DNA polymerase III delta prime subunit